VVWKKGWWDGEELVNTHTHTHKGKKRVGFSLYVRRMKKM
jgi:hypothetical protein